MIHGSTIVLETGVVQSQPGHKVPTGSDCIRGISLGKRPILRAPFCDGWDEPIPVLDGDNWLRRIYFRATLSSVRGHPGEMF
jgi:hypothetical protein